MTADDWGRVVKAAADRPDVMYLLSLLLEQQDEAKAKLCQRFACTGRPWPDLVRDILDRSHD